MAARIMAHSEDMAYVEQELSKRCDTMRLVDSCSLIKMAKNGVDIMGTLYTTPALKEGEMAVHETTGKLPEGMLQNVMIVPHVRGVDYMKIKEDLIHAAYEVLSEKKQTRDPISQEDLGLAVEAVRQAKAGRCVTVLSEDEHVYAPLARLLETDGYKKFASAIEIMRIRELCG